MVCRAEPDDLKGARVIGMMSVGFRSCAFFARLRGEPSIFHGQAHHQDGIAPPPKLRIAFDPFSPVIVRILSPCRSLLWRELGVASAIMFSSLQVPFFSVFRAIGATVQAIFFGSLMRSLLGFHTRSLAIGSNVGILLGSPNWRFSQPRPPRFHLRACLPSAITLALFLTNLWSLLVCPDATFAMTTESRRVSA